MNKAISEGRFGAAEIYANQIARRESAYEEKQVSRMVKDKGMTRSEAEDSVRSTKQQNDPMGTLVKYTEEIKKSVSNIDKNLPQKALTA
jgi:adenylosuccinate lyase